ncbi:MAG: 3-hydroxybutyryl-CoA dehydrogenase [Bacteroidetes bacterium]|nr:3-hydroxybutyryl-CoA dehydrogenase [Bacteroidota bacterium]
MGSGIAQIAAQSGFDTILYDVDQKFLDNSKTKIEKILTTLQDKGKITSLHKKEVLDRLHFTTHIEDCKADLVIEAIIENKEAKVALFKRLQSINGTTTLYASNTSSIFIHEIAADLPFPELIAGMHFFNPAPLLKLVEIIRTEITPDSTIQDLVTVAKQMNKTPVICKDAPGFIVNRVARHYYLEALYLLEKENIPVENIDTIMEASGFKMGPFKLMDLIGIDINYATSNIVWNALHKPDRLKPSNIQKEKVEKSELGKKTGMGFYHY